jgi:hypothetical protein
VDQDNFHTDSHFDLRFTACLPRRENRLLFTPCYAGSCEIPNYQKIPLHSYRADRKKRSRSAMAALMAEKSDAPDTSENRLYFHHSHKYSAVKRSVRLDSEKSLRSKTPATRKNRKTCKTIRFLVVISNPSRRENADCHTPEPPFLLLSKQFGKPWKVRICSRKKIRGDGKPSSTGMQSARTTNPSYRGFMSCGTIDASKNRSKLETIGGRFNRLHEKLPYHFLIPLRIGRCKPRYRFFFLVFRFVGKNGIDRQV